MACARSWPISLADATVASLAVMARGGACVLIYDHYLPGQPPLPKRQRLLLAPDDTAVLLGAIA
jgi:hypothetical protein